jgi:ribonuclease PH
MVLVSSAGVVETVCVLLIAPYSAALICFSRGYRYAPAERSGGADFSSEAVFECQAKFAPFALRPKLSPTESADRDRSLSLSVEQALRPALLLDRFPKSAIAVFVVVLQAGGGEHSASVIAAALALADAGIDLLDLPVAIAVGHHCASDCDGDRRLIVDPSAVELAACSGVTVISMLPRLGRLTHAAHTGRVPADFFASAMHRAMEACAAAAPAIRSALVDAARKRARAASSTSAAPAQPGLREDAAV